MINLNQKVSLFYPDGKIVDSNVADVLKSIKSGAENKEWRATVDYFTKNDALCNCYVMDTVPALIGREYLAMASSFPTQI